MPFSFGTERVLSLNYGKFRANLGPGNRQDVWTSLQYVIAETTGAEFHSIGRDWPLLDLVDSAGVRVSDS